MSAPDPCPGAERCVDCQKRRRARHRRVCEACCSRKDRESNSARYTFENLKFHAGARGIPFDLSPYAWADFCRQTGYLERHGNGPEDL